MKVNTLPRLLFALCALIAVFGCQTDLADIAFDKQSWNSSNPNHSDTRLRMVTSLREILVSGTHRDDVIDLLGAPDETVLSPQPNVMGTAKNRVAYLLRADMTMDLNLDYLVIDFNSENRVERVDVQHWQG